MQIAVQPTNIAHPALLNLLQLYLYDLSNVAAADLTPSGRYNEAGLRQELEAPDVTPFLIMVGEQLVGFAAVGTESRVHPQFNGHSMMHFFIARRYRRHGYGRAAAYLLFEQLPGPWEIATYSANIPGISFWRSVVDGYTSGRYDETWANTQHWRGSIQLFSVQKEIPAPTVGL